LITNVVLLQELNKELNKLWNIIKSEEGYSIWDCKISKPRKENIIYNFDEDLCRDRLLF